MIFTNYPEIPMYENYGLLISGKWQSASDQEIISVVSPVTEQQIGHQQLQEKILKEL